MMIRGENRLFGTVVLAVFVSFLLVGCTGMFATPIKKILENPRDYSGKSVRISGTVTEVFGLIVVKYFIVKDKTGEIAVITSKPLPAEGAKITVNGTVQEAFSIGDKQLIVIVEADEK